MKTLDTLLAVMLFCITVSAVLSYKNNQTLNKRIDLMSCKLDIANTRIDVLSGKPARRVSCLDAFAPVKPAKHT